jgi:hypothetical protein
VSKGQRRFISNEVLLQKARPEGEHEVEFYLLSTDFRWDPRESIDKSCVEKIANLISLFAAFIADNSPLFFNNMKG